MCCAGLVCVEGRTHRLLTISANSEPLQQAEGDRAGFTVHPRASGPPKRHPFMTGSLVSHFGEGFDCTTGS